MSAYIKNLKTLIALLAGFISIIATGVALYDRFFPSVPTPNNALREEESHQADFLEDQREVSAQAQLIEPIMARMSVRNCPLEQIDILNFDEHQTPAAETASGLDGHYIAATLSIIGGSNEMPVSLQAEGNGKGPVAKSQALEHLRNSIENQLNELIHCKE